MPSDQQVAASNNTPSSSALRRGLPGHQIMFLMVLMLATLPTFGWAAWLLAGLPAEHVPKSASLLGVMLGRIHQLPAWATVGAINAVAWYLRAGARGRVAAWINFMPYVLLGIGLVLFYVGLGLSDAAGGQRWWEIAASGCLLAAILLTAGQILWLLRGRQAGIEFAHLFLIAAVEWLLVFGSADLFLRLHFMGQTAVPPAARFRLFELSMLGVLGNLVFAIGLHTWAGLFSLNRVRPRAWLLALVIYNIGMVLVALGIKFAAAVGAVLLLFGALLFLIGLGLFAARPGSARRLGRGTTLAGILWLAASASFLTAFIVVEGPGPAMGYDAFGQAIEHALVGGFFGVIVAGVGVRLIQAYLPGPLLPRGFLVLVVWIYGIATLLRELLALAAIPGMVFGPEEPTPAGMFYAMAACAGVQCAAMLALGLVVLRTAIVARRPSSAVTAAWRISEVETKLPRLTELLAQAKIPSAEGDAWTLGALAALLGKAPEDIVTIR